MATAPNLRITQNGLEIKPGDGFFKTGGMVRFERHIIDTGRPTPCHRWEGGSVESAGALS